MTYGSCAGYVAGTFLEAGKLGKVSDVDAKAQKGIRDIEVGFFKSLGTSRDCARQDGTQYGEE